MSYSGARPHSRSSHFQLLSSGRGGSRPPSMKDGHSGASHSTKAGVGMLDLERGRNRRDRTYVGSQCAVCEELLEHTLRGERILQLSCGHVSHEACIYELIRELDSQSCPTCDAPLVLDSNRGGNVLDIGKLGNAMRSTQNGEMQDSGRFHATQTPVPWDTRSVATLKGPVEATDRLRRYQDPRELRQHQDPRELRQPQDHREPRQYQDPRELHQRNNSQTSDPTLRHHMRNDSGATGADTSAEYADTQRRHDYDVQAMEASLTSHAQTKNPIPPPIVTVRSEFPTLNRSRQQQSLTCLVTVEVPAGRWKPSPDDTQSIPSLPLPSIKHEERYGRSKSPAPSRHLEQSPESSRLLDELTEDLHARVDNWHGLDFSRFGKLRLHGQVRVGKDRQTWQELECYLFSEMLICVKEKKSPQQAQWDDNATLPTKAKFTLKGSILIKKHLKQVESSADNLVLTLRLSVTELPSFHLQFRDRTQLDAWRRALFDINHADRPATIPEYEPESTDEDDYKTQHSKRMSSLCSSYGVRSANTAPTEYTNSRAGALDPRLPPSMHIALDIVVVVPITSSMQGLKITLLRDALRFLVMNLGERDRMGLVTFGSSGGGVPLVGMTNKSWSGWSKILNSIKPIGQKSLRADVVEGANVAMDLLMQRKFSNPLASILLISDSSTADPESVDFVVSRAEAAKVVIHSFGLGLTHKPDTMIELSTRTKASYTYVKDWMMLRECVAGCLGSLQTISHQNVKLKLRLPEGSPAKFVKISGALQITKRATGRDAEAALGDLRFGDKRDILVQLAIVSDSAAQEQLPQDAWETIVSGLEALGGPFDHEDQRSLSVEEVPLIQADLTYGDILRDGTVAHLPRPSLLAITMLPSVSPKAGRLLSPPIPPHPSVVQRRMELLTSDMLTRALTLVSRGQHERAHHLLAETRSILKGLGKGGLPPLPPHASSSAPAHPASAPPTVGAATNGTPIERPNPLDAPQLHHPDRRHSPSPPHPHADNGGPFTPAAGIDARMMAALDAELEAGLEWINHPAVFGRDSRKAVLQAIGVISSQRGYTFRTPAESLWAERIAGVKMLGERSRAWREVGDEIGLMEES